MGAAQPRVALSQSAVAAGATRLPIDPNWKPQTTFAQSFTVEHPVEEVWSFFADIGAVAACLPGTSLVGEPVDGHVDGQIKIKVGPISAEFQGAADVTRDEATRTGTIVGAGKDKRSNSSTRGLIGYAVKPGNSPTQTRVDLSIGFTLSGALAQFSRTGLIQDVASRIIAVFVQNLESRLSPNANGAQATVVKEFDAGAMLRAMALDYFKQAFRWLTRRT
jgi:carbon-monoxide dehydrogenase small subunit